MADPWSPYLTGEDVPPELRPLLERVDAAYRQRAEAFEARIDVALLRHPRDDSNPHGPWCPTCMVAWPCGTALDLTAGTAAIAPDALAEFLAGAPERAAARQAKTDERAELQARYDALLGKQVRKQVAEDLIAYADATERDGKPTVFGSGLRKGAEIAVDGLQ